MTTVLLCGQDPEAVTACRDLLGGIEDVELRTAEVALGGDVPVPPGTRAAVYVLDSAAPADGVDAIAVARLRAATGPVVVVATGADRYQDAAVARARSRALLDADVHRLDLGHGAERLRAALRDLPPASSHGLQVGAEPVGDAASPVRAAALEKADRAAYLRSSVARSRAALLVESAEAFRTRADEARQAPCGPEPDELAELIAATVSTLSARLAGHLRALYRGTFAGWDAQPAAPVPDVRVPAPAPPRQDRRRAEDAALLLVGASAGLGLGRALTVPLDLVGSLRVAALPVSLVLGLVCAVWLLRVRRRAAARSARRAWAVDAVAAARQRTEHEIVAALVAAESAASLALARGMVGTGRRAHASN
ncbi:hypothetical protein P0W64_17845 [Tsukamurella sp. 8F]|uniref:hypothetical protein n=1 Tax=unclassified Tsukamurella TaxID=2633480 RepID=UPI0023B9C36B|nr:MULTISPECIES: hypothetical protein [unclassified Tsukamurella]MDF0529896.1 hypothetical protein [Tsukamurella sp. 8J]MDF0588649.1 hypothetical protein [Tsukamurella sp. 8F]